MICFVEYRFLEQFPFHPNLTIFTSLPSQQDGVSLASVGFLQSAEKLPLEHGKRLLSTGFRQGVFLTTGVHCNTVGCNPWIGNLAHLIFDSRMRYSTRASVHASRPTWRV